METMNKVVINGRIVSIRAINGGKKIVTISSKNGRDVYPRVECTAEMTDGLKEHARVTVEAHIVSPSIRDKATGKWNPSQYFVADSITPAKTLTEEYFGLKGKFFAPPDVNICLSGEVVGVIESGDWLRYIIKTDERTTIKTNMKKLDRQPDIKKGTKIYAVCSVSTPKKEVNGRTEYYEDILITDLAVGE